MDTTGTFFLPPQGSTIAPQVDSLFNFILWISIFLFVLVIGAATIFTLKYRRRGKVGLASTAGDHTTLEIIWTVIPLAIVIAIFFYGFRVFINENIAPKDSLEIKLTAQRWLWTFGYPNGSNSTNDLVVPAGKPVKLLMSSTDVIHSFYVPDFRIKQDVLPNRYTAVWFEAPDPGEHVITCAEYCGKGHSEMRGTVRVLSANDYEKWLAANQSGLDTISSPVKYGESLYKSKGCSACHTIDGAPGVGPGFKGIFDTTVQLQGGKQAKVDENYIRESILEPQAKVVAGYPSVMPTFQGIVTDKDIAAIIAFIKSLSNRSEESGEKRE